MQQVSFGFACLINRQAALILLDTRCAVGTTFGIK
jgi:hypothetical protein